MSLSPYFHQIRVATAETRRKFPVFWRSSTRRAIVRAAGHFKTHPGSVIETTIQSRSQAERLGSSWAESFVFAGASAILLLLANLFPEFWYFSFFALTPLLYRLIKATPGESLRLGFLFGLSYFAVSVLNSLVITPVPALIKFICGTGLFAFFGWGVGCARQRWGFNPSLVALLWVGLEIGLLKLHFVGGLLGSAEPSHSFFGGLIALFGVLAAAAIIALLNSLLVLVILKIVKITSPGKRTVKEGQRFWLSFSTPGLSTQKVYLVPEGRAPPSA